MYYLWNENEIPLIDKENPICLPSIKPYIKDGAKSAVIVCPGGGYHSKAEHEGGPIAEFFNDCGISAFVLDYRVAPYKYPCPLIDAKRAVRFVRYNAEKFGIDKDKIGICGFSAGGHLAAMTLTSPENEASEYNVNDETDSVSSKVNLGILCYPVITSGEYAHKGSFNALCGDDNEELKEKLSLEKRVDDTTAPAFIWHTANDNAVPSMNSLLFALELAKRKITYELHIFRDGRTDWDLPLKEATLPNGQSFAKRFLKISAGHKVKPLK